MSIVPQLGMAELLVIGLLALIVVGPEGLPKIARTFGQTMAKVRHLADEFRVSFEQMARETEIEEMRKEIEELKKASPIDDAKAALDEANDAVDAIGAPVAPKD